MGRIGRLLAGNLGPSTSVSLRVRSLFPSYAFVLTACMYNCKMLQLIMY